MTTQDIVDGVIKFLPHRFNKRLNKLVSRERLLLSQIYRQIVTAKERQKKAEIKAQAIRALHELDRTRLKSRKNSSWPYDDSSENDNDKEEDTIDYLRKQLITSFPEMLEEFETNYQAQLMCLKQEVEQATDGTSHSGTMRIKNLRQNIATNLKGILKKIPVNDCPCDVCCNKDGDQYDDLTYIPHIQFKEEAEVILSKLCVPRSSMRDRLRDSLFDCIRKAWLKTLNTDQQKKLTDFPRKRKFEDMDADSTDNFSSDEEYEEDADWGDLTDNDDSLTAEESKEILCYQCQRRFLSVRGLVCHVNLTGHVLKEETSVSSDESSSDPSENKNDSDYFSDTQVNIKLEPTDDYEAPLLDVPDIVIKTEPQDDGYEEVERSAANTQSDSDPEVENSTLKFRISHKLSQFMSIKQEDV